MKLKQESLPQIHLVRDTDLGMFAYGLHILAGDFLRESEFNLRTLATNTGEDSIAIMGKKHMWLSDALLAYCPSAELYRMAAMTEYPGARAFLFHTERKEGGRLYGDVLMMGLDTLRQDIEKNTLYPYGVSMEYRDGTKAEADIEKWESMELCEKDALKTWRYLYAPEQVTEWQHFYQGRFSQWKGQAFPYMPQDLEERLNTGYMETAQNPDMDMYLIPLGTAKQMLLDGGPVYRLLPGGPEKIAPVSAVTGLWYEFYREFAVAPEDLGALDRLVRRETDRIMGIRPQPDKSKEHRPSPER
ncbi:hypothetical protein NSB25_24510 [Acetatifactor muris]|jgi:hypothetical protein|uniref:hypothetical protein n=1 Tax=Acetatifactor muris TaxID=879566 RepID=UPI00214ADF2E|nr:hypothetical protein [Acetatifactor muris]MCR2050409.1 hypothetical protein [Acetatifactor muris]